MKVLFQGSLGAYSHLAAQNVYPDAEIVPCKPFDECFSKAIEDDKIRIIYQIKYTKFSFWFPKK